MSDRYFNMKRVFQNCKYLCNVLSLFNFGVNKWGINVNIITMIPQKSILYLSLPHIICQQIFYFSEFKITYFKDKYLSRFVFECTYRKIEDQILAAIELIERNENICFALLYCRGYSMMCMRWNCVEEHVHNTHTYPVSIRNSIFILLICYYKFD